MGMNEVNIKHYKLTEIPEGFEVRNDRIKDVKLAFNRGFIIGLEIEYESGAQPVGLGYHNTFNVGWQLVTLLTTLADCGDSCDIRETLRGLPIRVAYRMRCGEMVADNTYIGHFMRDDFLYYKDIVTIDPPRGITLTEREEAVLYELDRMNNADMTTLDSSEQAVLRDAAKAIRRLGGV